MTLIDNILAGASIRVLLHPRENVQIDFPDMYETFDLRHIVLIGDRFFAKTATTHAIPAKFGAYDIKTAFSYAYSNYYSYVINSSHTENSTRLYHKNVYRDIAFIPVNNYEMIWDSERDSAARPVEEAITAGRRLKVALLDEADIWNIHPVHMPSFHVGKNFFELFTEQDAIPAFLRDKTTLEELETMMRNKLKEVVREKSPRNLREVFDTVGFGFSEPEFHSIHYTIRSHGGYLHAGTVLGQESPPAYKALKVFADTRINP
ncbi:MAG: hypothetical protein WD407_13730 [Rhodospirillales bacterium]